MLRFLMNKGNMIIKAQFKIAPIMIESLLQFALERNQDPWFRVENYYLPDHIKKSKISNFAVPGIYYPIRGGSITLYDIFEKKVIKTKLNRKNIKAGLMRMASKSPEEFCKIVTGDWYPDLPQNSENRLIADSFIQYIMFGKIKYTYPMNHI